MVFLKGLKYSRGERPVLQTISSMDETEKTDYYCAFESALNAFAQFYP